MSMPEHWFDIEFDNLIKNYILYFFSSYESKLKELHIIKDAYSNNENIMKLEESPAERFYMTHRSDIRQYLIKNKNYEYNGTGVWRTRLNMEDIDSYFNDLINF